MGVAKLTRFVARIVHVSCESFRFMVLHPVSGRAVLVVRQDVVIVSVEAGQQRTPGRTTHRSRHVAVLHMRAAGFQESVEFGHELQRPEFYVLVVGQHQHDVWFLSGFGFRTRFRPRLERFPAPAVHERLEVSPLFPAFVPDFSRLRVGVKCLDETGPIRRIESSREIRRS